MIEARNFINLNVLSDLKFVVLYTVQDNRLTATIVFSMLNTKIKVNFFLLLSVLLDIHVKIPMFNMRSVFHFVVSHCRLKTGL